MLPDVVEDFAKAHPSCTDVEPLFVSCFALCVKLAGGVSLGLSTATLQSVSYPPLGRVCLLVPISSVCSSPLQVRGIQIGSLSPWRQRGDGSRYAVLTCSHRASACGNDVFPLVSDQRDSGTADPRSVCG